MVSLKPFKGTRPFNEEAINIIAPSTDHLSEENIDLISNKNYWNYLKVLNPVGQLKESETLLAAKNHCPPPPPKCCLRCSASYVVGFCERQFVHGLHVQTLLHDGGHISKNYYCKRCLEFYSGYGKMEISAIWQKFLPTQDIAICDQNPFKNDVTPI